MTTVEAASAERAGEDQPTAAPSSTIGGPPPAAPVPVWLGVACAAGSGGALLLAFPPLGLSWFAPVAVVHFRGVLAGRPAGLACLAVGRGAPSGAGGSPVASGGRGRRPGARRRPRRAGLPRRSGTRPVRPARHGCGDPGQRAPDGS